ncbi:MAG: hypothetical protein KAW00_04885 [Dehalococcoidia bacterium]|nr:hypothetical protein [Dehalococcoidia bacterium]
MNRASWITLVAIVVGAAGLALLMTFVSIWYILLALPYSLFLTILYLYLLLGKEGMQELLKSEEAHNDKP